MVDDMPTLQLGKNGITDNFIKECTVILKKHKRLKVKILKSFADTKSKEGLAAEVARLPGKKNQTGHVLILT